MNADAMRHELHEIAQFHAELLRDAALASGGERERLLRQAKVMDNLARDVRNDLIRLTTPRWSKSAPHGPLRARNANHAASMRTPLFPLRRTPS